MVPKYSSEVLSSVPKHKKFLSLNSTFSEGYFSRIWSSRFSYIFSEFLKLPMVSTGFAEKSVARFLFSFEENKSLFPSEYV